jgi:phage N-6-adenine-methyltransferase
MTAKLRNADSGNIEYHTPAYILERVHTLMGGIDLDPFSNERANLLVKAEKFYGIEQDGFNSPWFGRVWMNPPFGKFTRICTHKLVMEYVLGEVVEACYITHANTSERWFQELAQFPQCFLCPRVNYIDGATGKATSGATKGSVITYLGPQIINFKRIFGKLGVVK